MNEYLREELYKTRMEYTSLMIIIRDEYEKLISLTIAKDWNTLSLTSSKLAIVYHKMSTVDKKLKELEEKYKEELFEG